jgi:Holliday junction resolvase RusA-like endonuclease
VTADRSVVLMVDVPPSLNHCYRTLPNGGRALSSQAKSYKEKTILQIRLQVASLDLSLFHREPELEAVYHFYFAPEDVYTTTKKAESGYKRTDLSNRIKLLEDCICEAVGFDDRLFFQITLLKKVAPPGEKPHVRVAVMIQKEGTRDAKPNGAVSALPARKRGGTPKPVLRGIAKLAARRARALGRKSLRHRAQEPHEVLAAKLDCCPAPAVLSRRLG